MECSIGDSVAINGVCLTVTSVSPRALSFYISQESLSRTTFGIMRGGEPVNVERALRLSDRLGGHLVLGHVDGLGRVSSKVQRTSSWRFRFNMDPGLSRYIIQKGSIAVDGVSLTVNTCGEDFFEVNVIPQTAQVTTLGQKKVGDLVNLETDLIGKYVEKLLKGPSHSRADTPRISTLDIETLGRYGFGE